MRRKEIPPCTRVCAASGRPLEDGERIVAVLLPQENAPAEYTRLDYASDEFKQPPVNALAWWSTQVPESPKVAGEWVDPLVQLLSDPAASVEARWDAVERLVRKRRLALERPDASDANSSWRARILDWGKVWCFHPHRPVPSTVNPERLVRGGSCVASARPLCWACCFWVEPAVPV